MHEHIYPSLKKTECWHYTRGYFPLFLIQMQFLIHLFIQLSIETNKKSKAFQLSQKMRAIQIQGGKFSKRIFRKKNKKMDSNYNRKITLHFQSK